MGGSERAAMMLAKIPLLASEFDLNPELDHAIRRNAEECRCRPGILGEEDEQRAAPARELALLGEHDGLPPQVVAGVVAGGLDAELFGEHEDLLHVRDLHEAVRGRDLEKAPA